jgi:hypothetical protein
MANTWPLVTNGEPATLVNVPDVVLTTYPFTNALDGDPTVYFPCKQTHRYGYSILVLAQALNSCPATGEQGEKKRQLIGREGMYNKRGSFTHGGVHLRYN